MLQYTKGDWKVKQKKPTEANFFDGFTLLVEDEKLLIALCDREGWDNHKERLANANLIAASPMMHKVLGTIKRTAESSGDLYYLQNALKIIAYQARQALAKVEKGS